MESYDAHRPELEALLGRDTFVARQAERRSQLRAIEAGLLLRSMFVASRP
jgi:hypothetical protein